MNKHRYYVGYGFTSPQGAGFGSTEFVSYNGPLTLRNKADVERVANFIQSHDPELKGYNVVVMGFTLLRSE